MQERKLVLLGMRAAASWDGHALKPHLYCTRHVLLPTATSVEPGSTCADNLETLPFDPAQAEALQLGLEPAAITTPSPQGKQQLFDQQSADKTAPMESSSMSPSSLESSKHAVILAAKTLKLGEDDAVNTNHVESSEENAVESSEENAGQPCVSNTPKSVPTQEVHMETLAFTQPTAQEIDQEAKVQPVAASPTTLDVLRFEETFNRKGTNMDKTKLSLCWFSFTNLRGNN